MVNFPDFKFEEKLWEKGFTVIGIDEVGRGAFAGPVGVGGVMFDPKMGARERKKLLDLGINDSKKLTKKKREYLSSKIKEIALSYEICLIEVSLVNKLGVGKATFEGMRRVVEKLKNRMQPLRQAQNKKEKINYYALVDGFEIPGFEDPQSGIVYGDSLSISIAAASIIAKVERDSLMKEYSAQFPFYGFDKNKGYGTLYHRTAISKFGISSLHRTDFCKDWI